MATTRPLGTAPEEEIVRSQSVVSGALHDRIELETREIEDDCRVAVRCHAYAASKWTYVYYMLGLPTVILAALAGLSAINKQNVLAAVLAIAVTIFAAANTFLNAGEQSNAHAKKRSEYEQLKNEIRQYRHITLGMGLPDHQLIDELTQYSHRRDVLNIESPQVTHRAYRHAKEKAQAATARKRRSLSRPALKTNARRGERAPSDRARPPELPSLSPRALRWTIGAASATNSVRRETG